MSCIAGLFDSGGAPIDPRLVQQMLGRMKARAPHGDEIRCEGELAFGQALLRTGESRSEGPQPISLDGRVWLVADARIDGRPDLIRRLRCVGRAVSEESTPGELILHAYHSFGERFTDHLIGDFAFALWDARSKKLICCRDHFGVRPFFFFRAGELFGFASHMDALLVHPRVSDRLNETSVADFLLFGADQDPERTIYRDILCLPPASRIEMTPADFRLDRYWALPGHAETRRANVAEYVENFMELFEQAVADRLPSGPLALQMSGGMDSTSIAAVAAPRSTEGRPVTAYNLCCRSVLPEHEERQYAEIAAAHLGIPLVCQDIGGYGLFERDPALHTTGPVAYPHLAAHSDTFKRIEQAGGHVLLSGHGGDAVMRPSASYYPNLLRSGHLLKLAKEIAHHVRHTGSLAGMGLRSMLRASPPAPDSTPRQPDWIDTDFAARVKLNSRWENGWQTYNGGVDAYRQLQQPWLSRNFEAIEALDTPVIVRYPFYDIRLVEFLMGLPNFMLGDKFVLREAMRGALPDSIRLRPKKGMPGDVFRVMATKGRLQLSPSACVPDAVDRGDFLAAWNRYCRGEGEGSNWQSVLMLTPIALQNWISKMNERSKWNGQHI